ncbi:hypothetical protein A33Q_3507 [Indibacter alkaliphilus LW1]|uniref:Uncharacterized protein n=1 Tax=Indibacter alkaliphilus (strain CCUG 57479 / KCTC 22604 / LW1) TaxID=1189612 RepID=S2DNQ9_INDAL|nr:hypothetical protein A33Q_3507 [Indibacter alkaliphilus LW1]
MPYFNVLNDNTSITENPFILFYLFCYSRDFISPNNWRRVA